jgi:hypothetical protein
MVKMLAGVERTAWRHDSSFTRIHSRNVDIQTQQFAAAVIKPREGGQGAVDACMGSSM